VLVLQRSSDWFPNCQKYFVIILLFGPPGCGKGTQAEFLTGRFAIPSISTGELFRAQCKAGTPLGKLACAILSKGGFVNDGIVNGLVAERISSPDCSSGFLLDGYPRTLPQAEFFDRMLAERGLGPVVSIHLDVPSSATIDRITARRQCPACSRIYNLLFQPPKTEGVCDVDSTPLITREDDRESVILERLRVYEELTGPVVAHYRRSVCHKIDGTLPLAEVSAEIARSLDGSCVPLLS
jgi:adenylate kinase